MAGEVNAFFSYSRTDSDFVDRLDADLRARGFKTWVDRRKLEGGQNWQREIEQAIGRFDLFIIVLLPPAVQSPYVRDEYEIALRLNKRIIPLMYRTCAMPTAPGGAGGSARVALHRAA